MTNVVKTMLNSLYDVFKEKFQDDEKAWDKYIEFIASDHSPSILNQLNHNLEWLLEDRQLIDKIFEIYQPHLLIEDKYDYLGEIYRDKILPERLKDKFLIPHEVAQAEALLTVGKTDKELLILDPSAGTGRRILAGYELSPNARYFGVESSNDLARIALTNMYIHNVKGHILHANRLIHEIDIEKKLGRYNWHYANRWYSQIDKLKPQLVDVPRQNRYK